MNAAMHAVMVACLILSAFHMVLGLLSVVIGVAASIQAEVWLAHSVSPIWSGGFFIVTSIMGIVCSKRRSAYMIMCFTAFSIVSLVTAIVSIQLLRLGLVNHTTDGHTFQKEHKDVLILVALGVAGAECLICIVSSIVSCRLAKHAKKELETKRDGAFHVQDDLEILEENNYPYGDHMPEDYKRRLGARTVGTVTLDVQGLENPGEDTFHTLCVQPHIHTHHNIDIETPSADDEREGGMPDIDTPCSEKMRNTTSDQSVSAYNKYSYKSENISTSSV